jgi:hypothetical protein
MYLDRQRNDGEYFTSLQAWETAVRARYPAARFEIEDHGHFQRRFAHDGDDPTGADQVGNFAHNAGEDHGHGFIEHA